AAAPEVLSEAPRAGEALGLIAVFVEGLDEVPQDRLLLEPEALFPFDDPAAASDCILQLDVLPGPVQDPRGKNELAFHARALGEVLGRGLDGKRRDRNVARDLDHHLAKADAVSLVRLRRLAR